MACSKTVKTFMCDIIAGAILNAVQVLKHTWAFFAFLCALGSIYCSKAHHSCHVVLLINAYKKRYTTTTTNFFVECCFKIQTPGTMSDYICFLSNADTLN